MSFIDDNPLMIGATGKFANVVVYRRVRGRIVMAKKPKRSAEVSDKQAATQKNFQKAAAYAKRQNDKPEAKKVYEEGINLKKHTAYLVAMSDYLKKPEIVSVDVSKYTGTVGQPVLINTVDDFRVVSVSVEILNAGGTRIEGGEASAPAELSDFWIYMTTAENAAFIGSRIQVTAKDVAGNSTVATFEK